MKKTNKSDISQAVQEAIFFGRSFLMVTSDLNIKFISNKDVILVGDVKEKKKKKSKKELEREFREAVSS